MSQSFFDRAPNLLGAVALITALAWVIAVLAQMLGILSHSYSAASWPSYLFLAAVCSGLLSLGAYFLGSGDTKSYVIIKGTSVFPSPGGTSAASRTLAPGCVVDLVSEDGAWSLIRKDGQQLGYVATTDLVPMS